LQIVSSGGERAGEAPKSLQQQFGQGAYILPWDGEAEQ